MAKRSKFMTWERHIRLGVSLKKWNDELVRLNVELGNTYGVTSLVYKRAARLYDALGKLRCELDECVHREHGERPHPIPARVYYGQLSPDDGE